MVNFNIIKKSKFYLIVRNFYLINIYGRFVSKEKFIRNRFKRTLNRELVLNNPEYYNDKLQWLKLYWRDKLATQCADKYLVREFVKDKIGEKYLNQLYGVFDDVNEISIQDLPESFVLKGTHGSGYNIISKNKDNMDWKKEFKKMRKWLDKTYSDKNQEWVYEGITPRIICEKYIEQDDAAELRDYRFFCFNGEVKFIAVDFSITDKEKTRRNLYDINWNIMKAEITYPKETEISVEKPKKLSEMIKLSEKLASDFPHARIDFYYINEEIIFGEITFFHQSGLGHIRPLEFEKVMGEWLVLPK